MATIRRLSDTDVRTIFESVHHNQHPPPHLHFQVVIVGPEGLRLSPPSYEFEDGLYILLKPQKKKAHPSEQPKVPPHLTDYVLTEMPPAACPWSLSGPQFPQPTAIQQRYCYPKGDAEYSSKKGGALWTMYGADGKENMDYRLLHVYFSAKRATNKGIKVKNGVPVQNNKRAKRDQQPHSKPFAFPQPPPPPPPPLFPQPTQYVPPPLLPQPPQQYTYGSPARDCNSPVDFDVTPQSHTNSPIANNSNFVSPHVFETGNFHPGDPFPPQQLVESSSHERTESFDDNFHLDDMDTHSMQELEDVCWSDPLFPAPLEQGLTSLSIVLEKMQTQVKETILAAPESDQAPLLSLYTSWARQVAQDPLNSEMSRAQV